LISKKSPNAYSSPNENIFKNEILEKLFSIKKEKKEKFCDNDKNMSPLLVKVDKFFIINRNPISPYITEKVRNL
jgi:hypothetical protein